MANAEPRRQPDPSGEGRVARVSARLATVIAVLLAGSLWAVPVSGEDPEINESGFTSAQVCGECHTDIYDSWRYSLHASSLADPIFDAAFMQAVKEAGEAARQLCLRCHAPMVISNEDFDLSEGVTREGVSCDFCHLSTYDEWKEGPYAREGVQCQNCHMVLGKGRVVAEEIKPSGTQVHLHNLIHDTDQLRSALTVQIVNTQRSGKRLQVDVVVENVGSGHCVPTGMPSREVLLTVTVDDGARTYSQDRRYRKVIADARGRVLKEDYMALIRGARVLNDNRIRPREARNERFDFDLSQDHQGVEVAATLTYSYSPMVVRRQELNVELGKVERVVY
ncbi:MAG: multiheme c-type cytochrome [Acidobacteriota bacterium]